MYSSNRSKYRDIFWAETIEQSGQHDYEITRQLGQSRSGFWTNLVSGTARSRSWTWAVHNASYPTKEIMSYSDTANSRYATICQIKNLCPLNKLNVWVIWQLTVRTCFVRVPGPGPLIQTVKSLLLVLKLTFWLVLDFSSSRSMTSSYSATSSYKQKGFNAVLYMWSSAVIP